MNFHRASLGMSDTVTDALLSDSLAQGPQCNLDSLNVFKVQMPYLSH